MKKVFALLLCCSAALFSQAQKRAVTETGENVILNDDGTWQYEKGSEPEKKETPTNPDKFKKGSSSNFQLKSKTLNIGIWLDSKKWSFKKAEEDAAAEYNVELKEGDLYAMIITEKIEIPLETLKGIALENGKAAAADLRIVKEEYRNVNGIKVLLLQMAGTVQGVKFVYYGYYYSNSNGTVQFITYTSQNLFEKHIKDCEELLNGLVEI